MVFLRKLSVVVVNCRILCYYFDREGTLILAKPNHLKLCREEAGLSKAELSRYSAVSEPTIRKIENEEYDVSERIKYKLVAGLNKSEHTPREYKFEEVFSND